MAVQLINLVEAHLIKYKEITSSEAFAMYGITRLSSIIMSLRAKGWPIVTDYVEGSNRYGNPTRYGVYRIPKGWKPADAKK